MYRKLVFVLTMLAVAFGSLSQVQAALATQRPAAPVASAAHAGTPASIATLRATGAVRPATAGRQMAHDARLRTEQRQVSLPLEHAGIGERRERPRRPRPPGPPPWPRLRTPAPASLRSTAGCQIFTIPGNATFTVGQSSSVYIFTGLQSTDRGLRAPSAHFRRGRHPAVGSHVHGHRVQLGDTFGNTGCGYRRHVPVHDHRVERWQAVPPCTTPSRSSRRARSPALLATHLHRRPDRDAFTVKSIGSPTCGLSVTSAHCRRESRSRTTGTARRLFREHRLRVPAARTRSRSPPRTVSRSSGTQTFTLTVNEACQFTSAPHLNIPSGQAGDDRYLHLGRDAHVHIVRDGPLQ